MTRLFNILVLVVAFTMASPGWSQVYQGPLVSEPAHQHTRPNAWPGYDSSGGGSPQWLASHSVHHLAPLTFPRTVPWDDAGEVKLLNLSDDVPTLADAGFVIRGQDSAGGGGSGNLAGDATNPTSNLTQYQVQNTFVPSTYEASGFAHTLSLQVVKPIETGMCFFPTWITRTTLPVVTTADPDGQIPIGPPNDSDFSIPLDNQSGLSDLVFISILNHPTDWGSWGIGPGFVAPTATRRELGEQSWKFSPTFAVVHTAIPTWQLGILGVYNFPLDGEGTESLLFQPLIVKQLGQGWYTGWGDDLWQFNTESGNFDMPLQLRLGKVHKIGQHNYNVFVTGAYTPDGLRQGPAPEWGIKLSIALLIPGG